MKIGIMTFPNMTSYGCSVETKSRLASEGGSSLRYMRQAIGK